MRLLIAIAILLNSATGFGQSAEFFVKNALHKFPKTNAGRILTHEFVITNTGASPLIISGYEVACSCTKVSLPDPIVPGAQGIVRMEFDTKGTYYQQDRTIFLQTNARKKTERLRFKVFVVPAENE